MRSERKQGTLDFILGETGSLEFYIRDWHDVIYILKLV